MMRSGTRSAAVLLSAARWFAKMDNWQELLDLIIILELSFGNCIENEFGLDAIWPVG
jgi:hypothetical protein